MLSAQTTEKQAVPQHGSKTRILDAAIRVIRSKGYAATRVEDICEVTGLTKGSFFHHFASKEEVAIAAAGHFSALAEGVFEGAAYKRRSDPLERLLGYVDFRKAMVRGDLPEFTCLLGTMVQETYETHPAIREVCEKYLGAQAEMLVPDIRATIYKYGIQPGWTAESLAFHMQAVIQGAFILAKAQKNAGVAVGCLDHLGRFLKLLFLYSSAKSERL